MIQALGTLKLFEDIKDNKLVEGFQFTQFKKLEDAVDNNTFYSPINNLGKEKEYMKEILFNHFCSVRNIQQVISNYIYRYHYYLFHIKVASIVLFNSSLSYTSI